MASSDQEAFACNARQLTLDECRRRQNPALNDQLRTSLRGGRIMISAGVSELGSAALPQILSTVRQYDRFEPDNDPYGEHDFGSFSWNSHELFWKIDYYDLALDYGSPNPSDASITSRVLTIMLAREY